MAKTDCITVAHGKLTLDVPRGIFRGADCVIDEERAAPFIRTIMARYPWISESSAEALMNKARKEMIRILCEETGGRSESLSLARSGRTDDAIALLRKRLEENPDDADSWYALGELLFSAGDQKGGFEAFARGRKLATGGKTAR